MGNRSLAISIAGILNILVLDAKVGYGSRVSGHPDGSADDPLPPVWPGRFHATIFQKRGDDLGITDLWYDYAGGRNLNVIQTQSGEEDGPLFDNEWANGTTYYYLPAKAKAKYCNVIDFGVGILKPDWLDGATYLGEEAVGIYDCYKWEQGEIPSAHARSLGLRTEETVAPNLANADGSEERYITTLGVKNHKESWGSPRDVQWTGDGRFITYWSEKISDRPVKWIFFDGAEFEVIRFDEGATTYDDLFQIPDYCFSNATLNEATSTVDEMAAF